MNNLKMQLAVLLLTSVGVLGLDAPNKPASLTGAWQVDPRHSDGELNTDATTDYGKKKINVTLGFTRVSGMLKIGDADATQSSVDLRIYPATSWTPSIDEDGKFLSPWLENLSHHTLLCFHSEKVVRTPDGRLQATGNLSVTRVDRNVEAAPGKAYAGPVYGPPVIHRASREATFVFDFPATDGNENRDNSIEAVGSTSIFREDFPQLVRAVVSTYWPLVVVQEVCKPTDASETYSGSRCVGRFMETPGFAPQGVSDEGIGVAQNFNAIVGEHLTILVHLRLMAKASAPSAELLPKS
jgi:polyisoprenoid-binding protein YceI